MIALVTDTNFQNATIEAEVAGVPIPSIDVNDLKLPSTRGQVGLWAFIATDAYFSNLQVTREP